MRWQEQTQDKDFVVPDDVVDLSFKIDCRQLPVDHAHDLAAAICAELPWTTNEPNVAIHSIHGAASGNGWARPEAFSDSVMQLSRRTRMYLRIPKQRINEGSALSGKVLSVGEFNLGVGVCQTRSLVASHTIFSRSVVYNQTDNEDEFIDAIAETLLRRGIQVNKILCGLSHDITTMHGIVHARSILLADLELADAISLQQTGIGDYQLLGCGIFLPHKSLAAVGTSQE